MGFSHSPANTTPSSKRAFPRRSAIALLFAAGTIVCGLLLRLVHLGASAFVVKWGGSLLWAAMVYWLLVAAFPGKTRSAVALVAGMVAAVVELSRLYHTAELDAFRRSTAGILLLGRVFEPWHFVIYGVAIGMAALADGVFLQ
jgi:hypothetical protein